jgi:hypothetical protein
MAAEIMLQYWAATTRFVNTASSSSFEGMFTTASPQGLVCCRLPKARCLWRSLLAPSHCHSCSSFQKFRRIASRCLATQSLIWQRASRCQSSWSLALSSTSIQSLLAPSQRSRLTRTIPPSCCRVVMSCRRKASITSPIRVCIL